MLCKNFDLYLILFSNLQSLNFEELKLLHKKTCDATATMLNKSHTTGELRQIAPLPAYQGPEVLEKQTLMQRISVLENDLIRKQKHAQQKGNITSYKLCDIKC